MPEANSPAIARWPTIALLVITHGGVPAGALAMYKDWVLQHPGPSLGLFLAYEALALAGDFGFKVWQRLESRWVDRAADTVDRRLQTFFSRYERRYLKWVFYRYRDFDVKGLSTQGTYNLELEQVFVDLIVEPRPAHTTSGDPIRIPRELTGRKQIWDYLGNDSIEGHLALIGPPGSGKTTLLQKIALQLTGRRRRVRMRQTIPILLFLREHAEAICDNPLFCLEEVIESALERKQAPPPPVGWLKSQLESGRCLVLLDGLDEVAALEVRSKVVDWVETQIFTYPDSRFLITSRPHGYRTNPLALVTILEVQPFTFEQVERFVHNWYLANEIRASNSIDQGVKMKAREGAEDLLRRLRKSSTLTDLAVNPLLLTMIATVHRYRSSLPGRRVELYSEICEVFLGKRQEARGMGSDLTPAQKQRVLQSLAYGMMTSRVREILCDEATKVISETLCRVTGRQQPNAEEAFIKEIENSSGLLLERDTGRYSFAHLAFQEYLAATHAHDERLGSDLTTRVDDPWWHETLRLFAAQGDASQILAACLESKLPSVTALGIAVDCLEESREADLEWRSKIQELINLGAESDDPERFRLAAETLLARRLKTMTPVADGVLASGYINHAEYQLFLDQMRASGVDLKPDHWLSFRFPAGQALTPVVGVRATDSVAFCDWLTSRAELAKYRLPGPLELSSSDSENTGVGVRGAAEGYWLANKAFHRAVKPMSTPSSYARKVFMHDLCPVAASEESPADARGQVHLSLDGLHLLIPDSLSIELAKPLKFARSLGRILTFAQRLRTAQKISEAIDKAANTANSIDTRRLAHLAKARSLALCMDLDRCSKAARSLIEFLSRTGDIDIEGELKDGLALQHNLAHELDVAAERARPLSVTIEISSRIREAYNSVCDLPLFDGHGPSHAPERLESAFDRNLEYILDQPVHLPGVLEIVFNRAQECAKNRDSHSSFEGISSLASSTASILGRLSETMDLPENIAHLFKSKKPLRPHQIIRLVSLFYINLFTSLKQPAPEDVVASYVRFSLLEGRITGELHAFEGLRIVKEL